MSGKIAVSACLAGQRCRYDGKHSHNPAVLAAAGEGYIGVCPELLAGLPIPRTPCEILGGGGEDVLDGKARIIKSGGGDITAAMVSGAGEALRICLECGVTKAYLKARSPSCGCGSIYDGSFSKTLISGNGVFTALLLRHGIEVIEC